MKHVSAAAMFIVMLASAGCSPSVSGSPSPSGASVATTATAANQRPTSAIAMDQSCVPNLRPRTQVAGLPADAVCVTSVRGNFDGLSGAEALTTYSLQPGDGPARPWYIRADLTGKTVIVVDLRSLYSDLLDVTILGAADARGDGHDVAFVVLRHGASTDFVGLLEVNGARIVLASVRRGLDQGRKVFAIGGTVTHGDGLTCTHSGNEVRLTMSGWHTDDGGASYSWTETSFGWSGLDLVGERTVSGSVTSLSDPRLTDIGGGLRCGTLLGV